MKQFKYIYVLGIGGIGMSALARWFNRQGAQVFGHDISRSSLTDQLVEEGITIHFEVEVAAIPTSILNHPQDTLVLYSPSISTQNPIWQYLVDHGYQVSKRGEVLSSITQNHNTLAVAGTHGKTTSTTLAAHILCYANKNITAFLGGISKNYHTNFIASSNREQETNQETGQETTIVIEADEFDRFFLQLNPDIAIVTTVDPDHLDTYGDVGGFEEGFRQFLNKLPAQGLAILHRDVAEKLLSTSHPLKAQVVQYGLRDVSIDADHVNINQRGNFCYALGDAPIDADHVKANPRGHSCYALSDVSIYANHVKVNQRGCFCFDYMSEKVVIKDIELPVPGYHNVENALAVITACLYMGVAPEIIREAIHTFQGAARRFDKIIERDDLVFLDDYGHHPVEITALLTTIRKVYPGKKITAIFRPNQYSRTQDFLVEIAQSLDLADCVFLLDIYSDREAPIEGVDAKAILDKMNLSCKYYAASKEDLIKQLSQVGKPEIVVNLGAGDADKFIEPVKDFLLQNYS